MPDPLIFNALHASQYQTADPVTLAEVTRNKAVALLHRALAERENETSECGTVVPLKAGARR